MRSLSFLFIWWSIYIILLNNFIFVIIQLTRSNYKVRKFLLTVYILSRFWQRVYNFQSVFIIIFFLLLYFIIICKINYFWFIKFNRIWSYIRKVFNSFLSFNFWGSTFNMAHLFQFISRLKIPSQLEILFHIIINF